MQTNSKKVFILITVCGEDLVSSAPSTQCSWHHIRQAEPAARWACQKLCYRKEPCEYHFPSWSHPKRIILPWSENKMILPSSTETLPIPITSDTIFNIFRRWTGSVQRWINRRSRLASLDGICQVAEARMLHSCFSQSRPVLRTALPNHVPQPGLLRQMPVVITWPDQYRLQAAGGMARIDVLSSVATTKALAKP